MTLRVLTTVKTLGETEGSTMDSRQLSIPIYLNQRIVFDLLAIAQNGFSEFRTIRTSETDAQRVQDAAEGQIGVSNVFAFLGMRLKGSRARENSAESQREVTEERVFTPTSLFSALRDILLEKELIHDFDQEASYEYLSPGTFVEFSALLRKNPFVETLEGMIQLLETIALFENSDQPTSRPKKGGKSTSPATHPKSETQTLIDQMRSLTHAITQSNTVDLVADLGGGPLRAVVPVEFEYFSDKTPAAIIDGQFVVLGKVVRTIPSKGKGAIDLLRGTSLGLLHNEIIDKLQESFATMQSSGFKSLDLVTRIDGPAVQVIPIAIFA